MHSASMTSFWMFCEADSPCRLDTSFPGACTSGSLPGASTSRITNVYLRALSDNKKLISFPHLISVPSMRRCCRFSNSATFEVHSEMNAATVSDCTRMFRNASVSRRTHLDIATNSDLSNSSRTRRLAQWMWSSLDKSLELFPFKIHDCRLRNLPSLSPP